MDTRKRWQGLVLTLVFCLAAGCARPATPAAPPAYDAAGPTGMLGGYRQDDALCLWLVEWTPAEDANCPDDQPISACELAPEQRLYTVAVDCLQP